MTRPVEEHHTAEDEFSFPHPASEQGAVNDDSPEESSGDVNDNISGVDPRSAPAADPPHQTPVTVTRGPSPSKSGSSSSTLRSSEPSPLPSGTVEAQGSSPRRQSHTPEAEDEAEDDHLDPSDDDDSGSDYGERVARERQSRANRVGHDMVDFSDQEDEEEDLRLQDDVVPESDDGGASNRKQTRKAQVDREKGHRKDKGKGRMRPQNSSRTPCADDEIDAELADVPRSSNKPGPLPQEAKEKIAKAGAEFRALLMEYSIEYGKEFSEIAFTAGWSMRSMRKDNIYNIFKCWYAKKNVKPAGSESSILSCHQHLTHCYIVSRDEWRAEMDAAYEDYFRGVDEHDDDARRDLMEPIRAELETLELKTQEPMKVQSATSRIRRCKEQCVNMVRPLLSYILTVC